MFNIFGGFESYQVTFEIYIGNQLANKQTMQAPKEMLMVNFIQTAEQIGNDKRPMKLRMTRPNIVWDDIENKEKTIQHEISFSNNAMIAFEKDKEEGGDNQ